MQEARELMIETMRDLRNGKCPQKVAEIIHKNGHSIAMNQFAETRMMESLGHQETVEMLNRAYEKIKEL